MHMIEKKKTVVVAILRRALGDKGLDSLMQQYEEAKMSQSRRTPPTSSHIHLAELGKKMGTRAAAEKVGVHPLKVEYALTRVARWDYLNS